MNFTSDSVFIHSHNRRRPNRRVTRRLQRSASLACHRRCSPFLSSGLVDVMTVGDVLAPMQTSSVMARMSMVRSSSPKSVVSECSPIKKRRVDGFCSVDYRHRRGSRSGDLALLRVLSAPSSPLAGSSPAASRHQSPAAFRQRPCPSKKLYHLEKPAAVQHRDPIDSAIISPIELKGLLEPGRRTNMSSTHTRCSAVAGKAKTEESLAPSQPREEPTSTIIRQAEAMVGPSATSFRSFIPPEDENAIACLFNPEPPVASSDGQTTQHPPSLRQRIESLPMDGSLIFIYPTQAGASTFVDDMLMPVLDPLIRRAVNDHGLPDHTAKQVRYSCRGTLPCMMDFDELKETCEDIVSMANSESAGRSFDLCFAQRSVAKLPAATWKQDWIAQERSMIREAMQEGLRPKGGGANVDYSGIVHPKAGVRVAEDLLTDLRKRRSDKWEQPARDEVEVGVFVIRRH